MIPFNKLCVATVSVAPGTISANTSSEVTVTLPGLQTTDIVLQMIKPTLTAGIDISNPRISAANTLKLTFQNSTGSGVAVPTETYSLVILRPDQAPIAGAAIFNNA